jgi:glycogen debranching enzyme
MSHQAIIDEAYEILERSIIYFQDRPVGTVAACDPSLVAENYAECFVRDFIPSALVFMIDGNPGIVRNFLRAALTLAGQQKVMAGHERATGLMPASFKVNKSESGHDELIADFGEKAIGRVAPVDSAMWWMILLHLYTELTDDQVLAQRPEFQEGIRQILSLYLKESFETSPAMLVPDGSFMIDRRMGVYGHPLEIQSLFYGMLHAAQKLLLPNNENLALIHMAEKRMQTLRSFVRIYFWLDKHRLNEIHRYKSEEFGLDVENLFNIYPETIPKWIDGWLADECGYFVGDLSAGRMDFRVFSLGNMLAIMFDLATEDQASQIMNLYAHQWDVLIGEMPLKIVYPAVSGNEWEIRTGSDPKNVSWSYHNGGSWPTLIWPFVGAAIKTDREDLAVDALKMLRPRLQNDKWAEYYDGKRGTLIGRRANFYQLWTATGYLVAEHFMTNKASAKILDAMSFKI